jgi:hypothetical protein
LLTKQEERREKKAPLQPRSVHILTLSFTVRQEKNLPRLGRKKAPVEKFKKIL